MLELTDERVDAVVVFDESSQRIDHGNNES